MSLESLPFWHPPQPKTGYVVDIQFFDSPEVISAPFKSVRDANKLAAWGCASVMNPKALGVASVVIYSARLVEAVRVADQICRRSRM